jgi:hypothetical protein
MSRGHASCRTPGMRTAREHQDPDQRARLDVAAWVIVAVVVAGFLVLVASLVPAWARVPSKADARTYGIAIGGTSLTRDLATHCASRRRSSACSALRHAAWP